jgi:biotin carboxyl carrier protein
MQKRKSQRTPKATTGRVFSSKLTTPGMSFAVALRGKTEEQQQSQTQQAAGSAKMEPRVPVALPQEEQQKAGQSVRAPNINSLSLDKMLKVVVTVGQQIMTETNGAVLEVAKILLTYLWS